MAKKSFKENPALSFISQALAETAATPPTTAASAAAPQPEKDRNTQPAPQISNEYTDVYTHTNVTMPTDAPVSTDDYDYASDSTHASMQDEVEAAFTDVSAQPKPQPAPGITGRGESKSKRLQLLLRPSTHQAITRLAKASGTSVNDTIHQILEDYLRNRA